MGRELECSYCHTQFGQNGDHFDVAHFKPKGVERDLQFCSTVCLRGYLHTEEFQRHDPAD